MKPAPFEYHCPRSLDEALALLAAYGDEAKPLAGGQSLNAIPELAFIADGITIGAMTRHRELERSEVVARHAPLIAHTMPHIAHAAIRTRGTVGGSLAHADPAAELPAVMLALDASFTVTSQAGSRTIAADDLFVGLFTTAIAAGELLTAVTIPDASPGARFAFREISRRHGDFALAGVAAAVRVDNTGRCDAARIALLSVGERPVLATHAARALIGETPSVATVRGAAHAAATDDVDPPSDLHASSRYRRHLVEVLTRRALHEAFALESR
jgi:aerobic carbon-monoxide dehydrogenase medium subunit